MRSFSVALLGVTSLVGLAASCGGVDGDSVVVVHVTSGGTTLPAVFQLRATLSNDEAMDLKSFPATPSSAAIDLATAFSVTLTRARMGNLDIALDAVGQQGTVVANGASSVTLNPGGQVEVTIPLVGGPSLCGNGHVDTGEECDDGDRVTSGTCDFRCRRRATGTGDAGTGTGGSTSAGGGGNSDAGSDGGGGLADGGGGLGGRGAGGAAGLGGTGVGGGPGGLGGAGVGGFYGAVGGRGAGGGAGSGGIPGSGGTGGSGGIGGGPPGIGGGGGIVVIGMGGFTGGGGVSGPCSTELLTNGTFDAGNVNWTPTLTGVNTRLIYLSGDPALAGVVPASPYYLALLGLNVIDGEEILSQPIYVPLAASLLTVQGFFRIETDTPTPCPQCNPGVLEIVRGAVATPVKSWSNRDMTTGWTAFGTTIDAVPLRGASATFRMRVSPNVAPATRYFFDSLSVRADQCGP